MNRLFNLPKSHSFFLFGARGTGKTWLLRDRLLKLSADTDGGCLFIDLLNPLEFDDLSRNPAGLSDRIAALGNGEQWVVIDEVQKIPALLDVVHLEIEAHKRACAGVSSERPVNRRLCFALTGSSARKLKRGKANLLAGRAFLRYLYPLIVDEYPDFFTLDHALCWGGLPEVVVASSDEQRLDYLRSYVYTYLREEILVEQLAREAPPFRRFLEVAAQSNGMIVNYSSIARDVGLSPNTVQSYYQILEDTLLAYQLPPYHSSVRKRQRANPKYYLFDTGVQRVLVGEAGRTLSPGNYDFGRVFEHFIFLEIYRRCSYLANDYRLSYLRTKSGLEIDLIMERPGLPLVLVEIKSASQVRHEHLNALTTLGLEFPRAMRYCLSNDPNAKEIKGVRVVPWRQGLEELGLGLS